MTKEQQLEYEAKAIAIFEAEPERVSTDIAKELGVGQATVARYRRKWLEDKKDKAVSHVSNLDPQIVLALAERLEHTSPALAQNLQHLSAGLESLNKLEPVVHNAVGDLIVQTQERMSDPEIKTGEFKMLGELILKAYATLYNRPSVEINVQNNNLVQRAVSERLDSLTDILFDEEN
jgi:transposase-like protein